MSMTRVLGRSEIPVSALGAGCWAIGGPFWSGDQPLGWGEVDDDESVRAVHALLDAGVTFFDTADVYGAGHSERILGRALRGRWDDVVVATKFGNVFDEVTKQVTGQVATPQGIREACDASLARLGTDRIDLLQFHLNDFPAADAATVRDTCEDLVAAGLIRAYGWSTDHPERAAVFAAGPHCATVQFTLNVFEDNPTVLAMCDEADLAAINRGPLAMGLLTGKYTDGAVTSESDLRRHAPQWLAWFVDGRATPEFLARLEAVREVLTSGGRTLAQGALAWIWGRSTRTVPIPGFRTVAQAVENAAAMDFGPLTTEQLTEVDRLLTREPVH